MARVEAEQIKIDKIKSGLISRDDVRRGWSWRVDEYKSGLEYIEKELPVMLEGKTQAEMKKIINDFVWSMFARIYQTGSFCPVAKKRRHKRHKINKANRQSTKDLTKMPLYIDDENRA